MMVLVFLYIFSEIIAFDSNKSVNVSSLYRLFGSSYLSSPSSFL